MKLSAVHLKRYREIASLFWRYGRADLGQQVEQEHRNGSNGHDPASAAASASTSETAPPDQLATDLEAMGPTYVKLGQVLSSRPDLIPEAHRKALERLQDKVKPFSYEEVVAIVEAELQVRISKAFAEFSPTPIAAASLGQVHQARLRDGRHVVVKVQRPNIRPIIKEDFTVLSELAQTLDAHTKVGRRYRFGPMVEEFHLTIENELNYEREAQNLITMGRNLAEFEKIRVPQPVLDYTTRHVLTMDYINGDKLTSLSPVVRLDVNGTQLCEELFRAYLKQVLVDGIFHADPHPGNVLLTDDGRIALLDLGMVGHTAPHMQENLLNLLLAISTHDSEAVADIVIRASEKTEEFDPAAFRRGINQFIARTRDQGLARIKVGQSLLEVTRSASDNGLYVPGELTLLGKTLLQLDEIGRILAPEWDPNASVRRNVDQFWTERMKQDVSKGNVLSALLETKHFIGGLPSRLNRIMDAVANSELEVKVKSVDAKVVMTGMEKIANRITTGLILASLVVGASLLMRVQTSFQLFGYPGLAILCFIFAAAGGFWLVLNIFIQDYRDKKRIKR